MPDKPTLTADLAAAEAAATAAHTEVERLRAQLADERADAQAALDGEPPAPRQDGAARTAGDGRDAVLARYGRTRSGAAEAETDRARAARHAEDDSADAARDAAVETDTRALIEAARAEARRRHPRSAA